MDIRIRKFLTYLGFLVSVSVSQAVCSAVIDFEDFDLAGGLFLNVGGTLLFENADGSGVNVSINEGADNRIYDVGLYGDNPNIHTQGLIDWYWPLGSNPNGTEILFDSPVSNFSLLAGDFGADNDGLLTISGFDINNNLLGTSSISWDSESTYPFTTLSLSASNISRVVYQSGGTYQNSTFIDDISFTAVPEPAVSWLLSSGVGMFLFSAFYRRRQTELADIRDSYCS